jgi:uncharacterized protein with FMN-binding domain
MRRAILAFVGTVTGLVMLLTFKTHPNALPTAPAALGGSGGTSSSSSSSARSSSTGGDNSSSKGSSGSGGSSSKPTKKSGSASAGKSVSKTVTGAAENTPYGPIQIQVTLKDSKIVDVSATEYPNDPRSQQINSYAIPTLTKEAIAADSAKIDMVSGATYTSDGYIASLQSALDRSGI